MTVTFNPNLSDSRLERQLREVAAQGIPHILVDNGSRNILAIEELALRFRLPGQPVEVLGLGENVGIARAMNLGVLRCRELTSPDWVLTLDQDTCFPPDAFAIAHREVAGLTLDDRVGIIAFNYLERLFGDEHPYNRAPGPARERSIITSGNFVSRAAFDSIRFDDTFFVYFVDVEFCHRLRSLGLSIWVLRDAFIDHQEGRAMVGSRRRLSYLDPPRLFFTTRNGLEVFRRHLSVKALLVSGYLVGRNLLNGVSPRSSLRYALRGALATGFPDRFPPPRLGEPE